MTSALGSRPASGSSERRFPSKDFSTESLPTRVGHLCQGQGWFNSLYFSSPLISYLANNCFWFIFGQDTDEYKYVGSELKHLVDQMKTLMSERKQKQAEKASHHRRSRSNQNGYNRYDDFVFSEIHAERRCHSNLLKIEKYKYMHKVWDLVRFVVDNILMIYSF